MSDPSTDLVAAAFQAALPLDVLADPNDIDAASGRVWTRATDVVTHRPLRSGVRIAAGWGEVGWRSTLHDVDTGNRPSGAAALDNDHSTWTLDAPDAIGQKTSLDLRLREWHAHARSAMAELLPNAIDAATRSELVERILSPPHAHATQQESALRRLLAAHRTLRWAARRVILHSVALTHAGYGITPAASPPWRFLAQLARVPRARIAPDLTRNAILHSDLAPICPTARSMLVPRASPRSPAQESERRPNALP